MRVFSSGEKPTRNDVLEFGRRTRRNFEFIENAHEENPEAPVHVVVQLTLSLLGIVIFPYEKADGLETVFATTLAEIEGKGWLGWSIKLDSPPQNRTLTETLGRLFEHIRNAAAHGGLNFDSDSRSLSDVTITAEDKPSTAKGQPPRPVNWRAEIEGLQLRKFCLSFLEAVESKVS